MDDLADRIRAVVILGGTIAALSFLIGFALGYLAGSV